jgi:hypothetical protein
LKKYYTYFHALSLDVAAGAVVMSMLIARLLETELSSSVYLMLFLVVWGLYLTDHVLDSRNTEKSKEHPRLGIILHNFKVIKWILGMISFSVVVLAFLIPIEVLRLGFVLGVTMIGYFYLFHFSKIAKGLVSLKEPIIALIYAIGVCLPVFSMEASFFEEWELIAMIFLIALQNLLLFAVSERDWDQLLDQSSLIGNLGKKNLVGGFYIVNFLSYPIIYFFTLDFGLLPTVTFLIMNLWMAISFLVLLGDDNYWGSRMMGDATFILPLIFFLFY